MDLIFFQKEKTHTKHIHFLQKSTKSSGSWAPPIGPLHAELELFSMAAPEAAAAPTATSATTAAPATGVVKGLEV